MEATLIRVGISHNGRFPDAVQVLADLGISEEWTPMPEAMQRIAFAAKMATLKEWRAAKRVARRATPGGGR